MSILTDRLPGSVIIGGKICPINTDFRTWIKFADIIKEKSTDTDLIINTFKLIFGYIPPSLYGAMEAVREFYCPKSAGSGAEIESSDVSAPLYDFTYDAELIYAAFMQQYKMDLTSADLHWHAFQALFGALSEDVLFVKVMGWRRINLSDIKDLKMRAEYYRLKIRYRLPDTRSDEEKQTAICAELEKL